MSSACNHFGKEQQNKSKEHRRKYITKTRGNATKLETKTQNRNRQAKSRLFERNNKTDTQWELSYTHTANRLGIEEIKTVAVRTARNDRSRRLERRLKFC